MVEDKLQPGVGHDRQRNGGEQSDGSRLGRLPGASSTEYEVHNIGVNWPHLIFVNQSFKVAGAD